MGRAGEEGANLVGEGLASAPRIKTSTDGGGNPNWEKVACHLRRMAVKN